MLFISYFSNILKCVSINTFRINSNNLRDVCLFKKYLFTLVSEPDGATGCGKSRFDLETATVGECSNNVFK